MPKLPTYESPAAARGLQPSDRGIAATEQAGRAWNSAFHELGDAAQSIGNTLERHYAQKDAIDVTQQSSDLFGQLTDSWNKTAKSADLNDPEVANKWQTDVLDPALEKLGADVSSKHGEQEAATARANLRSHFQQKSIADQSTMAGFAASSNIGVAANNLGAAVRRDPSSFSAALGVLRDGIASQVTSHGVSADVGAKLRTDIFMEKATDLAQEAVIGLAEVNAPAAMKALDSGTFDAYFSPAQAKAMRSYVETQDKANTALVKTQNKDASEADMANIQNTVVDPNTGQLTIPKDYFSNVLAWSNKWQNKAGAGESVAEKARTAIQFGRSIIDELEKGKPAVTDAHTYEDFRRRVTLGQSDPNALTEDQVIQARADGMLSDRDYSFFKGAVTSLAKDPALRVATKDFNTFLRGIKSSITKSNILMGSDPAGDQKYLQFTQDAQAQFDSAYQKGDGSWRKLLERNNPASLWQQSVRYQTNQKGAMENLQNSIQGQVGLVPSVSAPARQKGESAAAYLARTGGK